MKKEYKDPILSHIKSIQDENDKLRVINGILLGGLTLPTKELIKLRKQMMKAMGIKK